MIRPPEGDAGRDSAGCARPRIQRHRPPLPHPNLTCKSQVTTASSSELTVGSDILTAAPDATSPPFARPGARRLFLDSDPGAPLRRADPGLGSAGAAGGRAGAPVRYYGARRTGGRDPADQPGCGRPP